MARAHIYNGLLASGFGQIGARCGASASRTSDLARCVAEWQRRRDEMLEPARRASRRSTAPERGRCCWTPPRSGATAQTSPDRLLEHKVAATPMRGWGGEVADRHVRLVFSNEPVERLQSLGGRVRAALGLDDRDSAS